MNRFYFENEAKVAMYKLRKLLKKPDLLVFLQFEKKYYYIAEMIYGRYKPLHDAVITNSLKD